MIQVTGKDQEKFGIKRTCKSCGVCFYDLDKHPSECPNCGAIYELHVNTRSRRATATVENYEDNISFLGLDKEEDPNTGIDSGSKIIEDDNPFDAMLDEE